MELTIETINASFKEDMLRIEPLVKFPKSKQINPEEVLERWLKIAQDLKEQNNVGTKI